MYNSIFQKPWWLDAVAPDSWAAVEVKRGGDTIARWPYIIKKRLRNVILTQPPLTQTLGPWLRPSKAKYANMLAEQKDLMTELINQLPPFDNFSQNFHYSITNWLPFYWQGFNQTTRYTYVIDDLSDINKVWDGLLPNIRTDIKKAQNRFGVEVCDDLGIDAFLDVNEITFVRQGRKLPYEREFVKRLDDACVAHDTRKIFFGRDKDGKIHAVVYIIWDEHSAYYLMGGGDSELRNSGATSLCMWEAIQFAAGVTRKFDFEGSMMEPVERFFRAFGAKQVPYFSISKSNSRLSLLKQAAGLIKRAVFQEVKEPIQRPTDVTLNNHNHFDSVDDFQSAALQGGSDGHDSKQERGILPVNNIPYDYCQKSGIEYKSLLKGCYEAERLSKDFTPERIVPDFAFNVLNPLGLLYRPVVDEAHLEAGGAKPVWPEGKPLAVCLTHDVDLVTLYSQRQVCRVGAQALRHAENWTQKAKAALAFGRDCAATSLRNGAADPLHCYERWLAVEAAVGARSTFFFWPGLSSVGKHHPSDCTYELTDRVAFDGQKCTVAEMIREIDRRGWEIGLHPSWYSFDDTKEMKRQKAALETTLVHDVVSVRQHYLHYDIRVTPRVQAEAGLRYDSTLGFNDNVGFRFGTCYPWRLYDLQAEEEFPIVEVPLIIQDGAMLNPAKGMRLDEDTAFQYVVQITEAVERVGGVLTLLWHPNAVMNPPWWSLYRRSLEYLKEKNAWFGSVRELARHFKPQPSM